MNHDVIYQIYEISRDIKDLDSKIDYAQETIEKFKGRKENYENQIKQLKEELSKICAENDINIDNLL